MEVSHRFSLYNFYYLITTASVSNHPIKQTLPDLGIALCFAALALGANVTVGFHLERGWG